MCVSVFHFVVNLYAEAYSAYKLYDMTTDRWSIQTSHSQFKSIITQITCQQCSWTNDQMIRTNVSNNIWYKPQNTFVANCEQINWKQTIILRLLQQNGNVIEIEIDSQSYSTQTIRELHNTILRVSRRDIRSFNALSLSNECNVCWLRWSHFRYWFRLHGVELELESSQNQRS